MPTKKTLSEIIDMLREKFPEINSRYQIQSLGVFGSYARQTQVEDSDLDILVTFKRVPGLLKYIELENLLSEMLGVKVDLVMKEALKPRIGERIMSEVIQI